MIVNKAFIAYSQSFVSFLFDSLDEDALNEIETIILFGSAARDDAGKKSDIDIFINVPSKKDLVQKNTEKAVLNAVRLFYESLVFRKVWKMQGIENEINCITGSLEKWDNLKPSMISDGIVLYGKYAGAAKGRQSFVIISWEKVKPETKRVLLSKKLYGYNMNNRRYEGAIGGTGTIKLGSNCLMIPIQSSKRVLSVFSGLGVDVRKFHVNSII